MFSLQESKIKQDFVEISWTECNAVYIFGILNWHMDDDEEHGKDFTSYFDLY